ncbi:hypothetical protein [Desulfosoma caldarium]|uniref:Uncharacterized protein n=1 Tax=Desulfosoma caldarium TaxID=610254 RepID=A0A3N1UQH5_9BACT|nr:hypothetical protein [Desulfosoma caldarium]ROQ92333.1 hypothetical protein EDC27_2038 [Desulfosoma caldarium]
MKKQQRAWLVVLMVTVFGVLNASVPLLAQEPGFTRQDRDLLVELRTRMLEMDKRIEQVDKRFDQLIHFLYILAGIFTSLVVAVIGFAYWERRTIISQAKKETKEDLEREGRLRDVILALREFAAKNEDLASILRSYHLL